MRHAPSILLFVYLCYFWPAQSAAGQSQPEATKQEATPKAITVDGQPALAIDYGDGMGFLIVYTKFHDKPAFRFSLNTVSISLLLHMHECGGFLWVSPDEIAYTPADGAHKDCQHPKALSMVGAFDLKREDLDLETSDASFVIKGRTKTADMSKYGFGAGFAYKVDLSNYKVNDAQRAESAAAAKIANPWLQLAFTNFKEAERQFLQAAPLALTGAQTANLTGSEKAGESAEQSGKPQEALNIYLAAIQTMPANSGEPEEKLRERIIRLATQMDPPPQVPEDAKRHLAYALAAIEDGKTNGDLSKLDDAVEQLNQVIRLAPWRPEGYYNLGFALEAQKQYGDAARNLKLYLLAAPHAQDAEAVQQKIYQLEYKSGAR